jgi:hypothetical protein
MCSQYARYFFAALRTGGALIAFNAPAFAAGESEMVDGWARTRSPSGCMTSYFVGPPPTLTLTTDKDGRLELALNGLNMTPEQMGQLSYPAVATVKLNGNAAFTKSTSKPPGRLALDISLQELEALTEPGQITFDINGNGGQQESITYASPGLASAIEFLSECFSK